MLARKLVLAFLSLLPLVMGTALGQEQRPQAEIDASWLTYSAEQQRLEFELIAGLTGHRGALNFNGFADGDLTLVVPLGWQVIMHFSNRDANLPHSAQVIDDQSPVPTGPVENAFPRAYTVNLSSGLRAGRTDDIRFTADKEGRFLIFCAVPGHGLAGMWIRLDVVKEATAPELRRTPYLESRP